MNGKDFRIGFRPAVDALRRLEELIDRGALVADDFYGLHGQSVGFARVSFEWVTGTDGAIIFAPSPDLKSLIATGESRL